MNEKHEFAFFTPEVTQFTRIGQEYVLYDKELVHRLATVIRIETDEKIILFNELHAITCTIISCSKKEIKIIVNSRSEHTQLRPHIAWLLPLLERTAFENAIETLTVMGATNIIPVITEKSRKKWGSEKDCDRARRLMIAAAEQSKQFILPEIQESLTLETALKKEKDNKKAGIFFDAAGKPAWDVLEIIRKNNPTDIISLVGPEGDLTLKEKELIKQHDFIFCTLTPTILRADAAITVGMGLLRSCF
jgi:16S rRNA (uracil1498-N3)-methyltransferase